MPHRLDPLDVAVRESTCLVSERRQFRDGVRATQVKIRPQASQSWFDLGCCRMRLADVSDEKAQLGKAARAFSRCVQHEPDCGDAWANLAACRLRSGQAAMAKNALDRAVATRPEDWRLWENLSRCCCMLRRSQEAMVSINRLLDLSMVSKRPVGAIWT